MEREEDGPVVLRLESGVVRRITLAGAQRTPAAIGGALGFLMIITALYGQGKALYGLILVALWHGLWVLTFARDPQYWDVIWRAWLTYPIPEYVEAWPHVGAPHVRIEPSIPYQGEAGVPGLSPRTYGPETP